MSSLVFSSSTSAVRRFSELDDSAFADAVSGATSVRRRVHRQRRRERERERVELDIALPAGFILGTSTAATQIETCSANNWKDVKMVDGQRYGETAQHEKRRHEDALYAAHLGNAYRFSVDWARIQTAPLANFDEAYTADVLAFCGELRARGVRLLLVLHHFTAPLWFMQAGGFEDMAQTAAWWNDYVKQCVDKFGAHVQLWNTFNEPNVYISQAYVTGMFPPFRKARRALANRVLANCAQCHVRAAQAIHGRLADAQVGISLNTVVFLSTSRLSDRLARYADHWFNVKVADAFAPECDFMGFSYYTRLRLTPSPLTPVTAPQRMAASGIPCDDMNEYYPEGLYIHGKRLWERYRKPLLITESGTATTDCNFRIQAIKDYFVQMKRLMDEKIPLLGVFHWSTMDNCEWVLSFKMRFGLVHVDNDGPNRTFNRRLKRSGAYWHSIVERNGLNLSDSMPTEVEDPIQKQLAQEAHKPPSKKTTTK
jgi:beta-glucosidase